MQVVILAGGLGTRLSEETRLKPKPMVEIGGQPILWHIMKIYAAHGFDDFVICLGYKGYIIKEYFANYMLHTSNVTVDLGQRSVELHDNQGGEAWRVTLVDTGDESQTGGRIRRVLPYITDDQFCMTYGDGVGDVDITRLVAFHRAHGKLATVTAVQPPGRFGTLELEADLVSGFVEKPHGESGWINGGFFVLSKQVARYLDDDLMPWELDPMRALARDRQMEAFRHTGFWQPMDTLRDRNQLEELWRSDHAPWKVW